MIHSSYDILVYAKKRAEKMLFTLLAWFKFQISSEVNEKCFI